MSKRIGSLLAFAATTLVVAGCMDAGRITAASERTGGRASDLLSVGGVEVSDPSIDTLAHQLQAALVAPVERTVPLAADVVWQFTVGSNGIVSSNEQTGLTITIPKNAVSSNVTITVRARAGRPVAYSFAPHGLVFNRKVHLTQDLGGTNASGLLGPAVIGAYFSTDELQLSDGLASVTETFNARINGAFNKATFAIEHFSGYIYASGRSEEGNTEGQ